MKKSKIDYKFEKYLGIYHNFLLLVKCFVTCENHHRKEYGIKNEVILSEHGEGSAQCTEKLQNSKI